MLSKSRLPPPVRIPEQDINREFIRHRDAIRALQGREIVDGRLIENITFTEQPDTENGAQVKHGLGRKYRGWILVKTNAAPGWLYEAAVNTDPSSFLEIRTTEPGSLTVSLWVF